MAKVKPYYAPGGLSAAYYDVMTAADVRLRGDDDIYAALAPPGGRILELGAGTGRLAAALGARGFAVCGIEIAPAMLAQAAARIAALPPEVRDRVRLKRGDMTALDLKEAFDLVICPYFTLAHVPTGSAWRNTFAVAAGHLPSGGLAAFHLPKLETMQAAAPPDRRLPVVDQPLPDGRRLRLHLLERTFKPGINRLEQVLDYVVLDAAGRVLQRSAERLAYYMADPEPLAATAGLVPDRPPIELGGVGDIWVFRKG